MNLTLFNSAQKNASLRYKKILERGGVGDPPIVTNMKNTYIFHAQWVVFVPRGGVRSMRGLGPTMTAQGQTIGISIGMIPQTLIMSRLDQISRLGARI
jgi:hypothetical protein